MRLRWQIELFWKLWKQEGKIDTWRSNKPQRILTEVSAKLLGVIDGALDHVAGLLARSTMQSLHSSIASAAGLTSSPCTSMPSI
jgi:hypothetical protein